MSITEISNTTNIPPQNLTAIIQQLIKRHNDNLASALALQRFGKGYLRLVIKPVYYQQTIVVDQTLKNITLSSSAYEVLAILIFHGNKTRREIQAIRQINSDGVISSLVQKKLIKRWKRAVEDPGMPWIYTLSKQLFQHFNVQSLQQLKKIITQKTKKLD